jgi:hypothetical protein
MHRDGDGRLSKSIWAHEPILTPERKLWRAVLTQAFEDAEMTPVSDQAEGEPLEAPRARRYLRADSPFEAQDLKLVCDFAELPADRVLLWARRSYPPEPTLENHVECGGSPPLFLPSQAHALAGVFRRQSEKREQGSRTPQIAAWWKAPVPA